jgi:hypothetical protein
MAPYICWSRRVDSLPNRRRHAHRLGAMHRRLRHALCAPARMGAAHAPPPFAPRARGNLYAPFGKTEATMDFPHFRHAHDFRIRGFGSLELGCTIYLAVLFMCIYVYKN